MPVSGGTRRALCLVLAIAVGCSVSAAGTASPARRGSAARSRVRVLRLAVLTPHPQHGAASGNASAAIAGNTIVIARPHALYVFVRPSSGWAHAVQIARLTQSAVSRGSKHDPSFTDVGISADGKTIVAGWSPASGGGGGILVFVKPASGWRSTSETADLTEPGGGALGGSVAISGNGRTVVGGDGVAAVVFTRPRGGWNHDAAGVKLISGPGGPPLGGPVAISRDGTVITGSGEFAPPVSIDVFVRPPSGWRDATQTARLTLRQDQAIETVEGIAASASGSTIAASVVGNQQTKDTPDMPGAVYVFERPATGWKDEVETARLTAKRRPYSFDELGRSMALSDSGRFIVTTSERAPWDEGAVAYVFVRHGSRWQDGIEARSFAVAGDVEFDEVAISAAAPTLVVTAENIAGPERADVYHLIF